MGRVRHIWAKRGQHITVHRSYSPSPCYPVGDDSSYWWLWIAGIAIVIALIYIFWDWLFTILTLGIAAVGLKASFGIK